MRLYFIYFLFDRNKPFGRVNFVCQEVGPQAGGLTTLVYHQLRPATNARAHFG